MVNAQSAPGTAMSSRATSQKARTELAAMNGLLQLLGLMETISLICPKVLPTLTTLGPIYGRIHPMDVVDHKILALLQEDGRLTITELAGRIGLSVSPCHRRLRELERNGTIRGYRAIVDADSVGLKFQALVFVTLRQVDRDTLLGFEEAVARIPNVVQAQRLFGDPDYLLRIVTADLAAYQQLEDDTLAVLPGIQRLNSTLVMKQVVNDRALPV